MAAYGFSYVRKEGYTSFPNTLGQGVWSSIEVGKYDAPDRKPTISLLEMPVQASWKLSLLWACQDLALADQNPVLDPVVIDRKRWDPLQRLLDSSLDTAVKADDPATKPAALRARAALLHGRGTEQTTYRHQRECDVGFDQYAKATQAPLKADIELLGLMPLIEKIHKETLALAEAIGYHPTGHPVGSRTNRVIDTLAACVSAFNNVLFQLDWQLQYNPDTTEQQNLKELRATLQALLDRYPAPAPEAPVAEEPAPSEQN